MATSKNSTFRINKKCSLKLLRALTLSMLLSLEIANAYALLFSRLIARLRFLPKSLYFFFNRIARYAQSKESKNLYNKIDEVRIPQITCKAIFRNCLILFSDSLFMEYSISSSFPSLYH